MIVLEVPSLIVENLALPSQQVSQGAATVPQTAVRFHSPPKTKKFPA
jgi:hypothetical protein